MKTPLVLLLCLAGMTAACGQRGDPPTVQTSRAPGATYDCIAPRLQKLSLRSVPVVDPSGWRMDLQIFTGPPAGWYRTATLDHHGANVTYMPDSANRGIGPDIYGDNVREIMRRCAR